jgi:hypothetical protein
VEREYIQTERSVEPLGVGALPHSVTPTLQHSVV